MQISWGISSGCKHTFLYLPEMYSSTNSPKFAICYLIQFTQIQRKQNNLPFISLLHITCFISSLSVSSAMDSWIDHRTSLYNDTVSWHWRHWWRIISKLPALPALLESRIDFISYRLPTSVKNWGRLKTMCLYFLHSNW